MVKENGVLAIGAVIVDVVCRMPGFPRSGEGLVAEEATFTLGGCAHNIARIVRQLGVPVKLCAPVGTGLFAAYVKSELAKSGLDALYVEEDADNGVCVCLVEPGGERTMLTIPGIDRAFRRSWLDAVETEGYSCAVIGGYEIEPNEGDAIIEFLEDHPGLEVFYCPGPRIEGVSPEKTKRLNALRPVWHVNDAEARSYTGETCVETAGFALLEACGNAVIITEGAKGAHLFTGEGRHVVVPARPLDVRDTVGAGDAHVATVAALRCNGLEWRRCLEAANTVAGAVCMQQGACIPDCDFPNDDLRALV